MLDDDENKNSINSQKNSKQKKNTIKELEEKIETLKQSIEIEKQLTVQASSHYNENTLYIGNIKGFFVYLIS